MPFEGIAKKGESLYDFPIVRVGGSPRDREIPAAHRLSVKFLPCIALSRPVASRVTKPRLASPDGVRNHCEPLIRAPNARGLLIARFFCSCL